MRSILVSTLAASTLALPHRGRVPNNQCLGLAGDLLKSCVFAGVNIEQSGEPHHAIRGVFVETGTLADINSKRGLGNYHGHGKHGGLVDIDTTAVVNLKRGEGNLPNMHFGDIKKTPAARRSYSTNTTPEPGSEYSVAPAETSTCTEEEAAAATAYIATTPAGYPAAKPTPVVQYGKDKPVPSAATSTCTEEETPAATNGSGHNANGSGHESSPSSSPVGSGSEACGRDASGALINADLCAEVDVAGSKTISTSSSPVDCGRDSNGSLINANLCVGAHV